MPGAAPRVLVQADRGEHFVDPGRCDAAGCRQCEQVGSGAAARMERARFEQRTHSSKRPIHFPVRPTV